MPVDALPGHLRGDPTPTAEALLATFRELSDEGRSRVLDEMVAVLAHYEDTGDTAPLRHFLDSLMMTARLLRNPCYREALAEADATPPGDGIEVKALVERAREKYGT